MKPLTPLLDRFDARRGDLDEEGHARWRGRLDPRGYGQISLGERGAGRTWAHRAAWLLYRGPIPPGMDVHHRCMVRSCVNPDHLELVPHTFHPLTTRSLRGDGCFQRARS